MLIPRLSGCLKIKKLKEMHQKAEDDLVKLNTSLDTIDKERDTVVSERTHLSSEVDLQNTYADKLEEDGPMQSLTSEAQTEYINHLHFLLDP